VGTILGLRKTRLILALAVLALAAGGGVLASGVFASSEPQVPPAPASTAISAQITEHFSVLNSPSAADVPTGVKDVDVGLNEQWGLNTSLAREVTYAPGTPAIWVIPGSTGICIHVMTEVGQGGCTSLKNALAGNLQIEVGGKTVYGVAPNGNSEVLVHDGDGSTERVAVHQNVYIISKAGAQSLDLTNGAGQPETVSIKE
jgi:hypothetical protein